MLENIYLVDKTWLFDFQATTNESGNKDVSILYETNWRNRRINTSKDVFTQE